MGESSSSERYHPISGFCGTPLHSIKRAKGEMELVGFEFRFGFGLGIGNGTGEDTDTYEGPGIRMSARELAGLGPIGCAWPH
jgi:hypothetical protein